MLHPTFYLRCQIISIDENIHFALSEAAIKN
jgi:hypothetical protein